MEPKFENLTEDQFYERFNMVGNHLDENASFDGCMFETFGAELKYIQEYAKTNLNKVWTILDVDGNLMYSSGFHFVNRYGYFITKEAVDDNCEIEVTLDGMDRNCLCKDCNQSFDEVEVEDGKCPYCDSESWEKKSVEEPEK